MSSTINHLYPQQINALENIRSSGNYLDHEMVGHWLAVSVRAAKSENPWGYEKFCGDKGEGYLISPVGMQINSHADTIGVTFFAKNVGFSTPVAITAEIERLLGVGTHWVGEDTDATSARIETFLKACAMQISNAYTESKHWGLVTIAYPFANADGTFAVRNVLINSAVRFDSGDVLISLKSEYLR